MASCRGCKADIHFAKAASGRMVPLQRVIAYEIDWVDNEDTNSTEPIAVKVEREIYISHFLTCPKANEFSKGRG